MKKMFLNLFFFSNLAPQHMDHNFMFSYKVGMIPKGKELREGGGVQGNLVIINRQRRASQRNNDI